MDNLKLKYGGKNKLAKKIKAESATTKTESDYEDIDKDEVSRIIKKKGGKK